MQTLKQLGINLLLLIITIGLLYLFVKVCFPIVFK